MALKITRSILIISFIGILLATLIPVDSVYALSTHPENRNLPSLNTFVSQVKNGQAGELRGVYIPDILAAPVVSEPEGNNIFVSPVQNILTQFNLASQFGSTGLLAHNYLAGERFPLLEKDQRFYLIYGDGEIATFVITEILRYQALEPASPTSKFIDLENNDLLTASELFLNVYNRPGNVIFQTCISKDDEPSWGRLFVIAEPSYPKL